jgi:hypothetical protein
VIEFFKKYYAIGLVLALVAPLWLGAAASDGANRVQALRDALIWTGVLLGCWLLPRHPIFPSEEHGENRLREKLSFIFGCCSE